MRIAYVVRAHHRPRQLGRLVDRLSTDNAVFAIHASRKTSAETYAGMREAVGERPNVIWTRRITTFYAGFSIVEAALEGLRSVVRLDPVPEHAVFLSGQDYPLRPASEIEAFFAAHPGTSFVHHYALPASEWSREAGGLRRIRHVWFERLGRRGRLVRLPLVRRRFPAGFTPYGGSAWTALSAEAAEYLVRFAAENPRFVRFFKHVLIPDELFVQTVLLNSPLRGSIVNEELHYVDWSERGVSPATLTKADLSALLASGKLFARKFDTHVDAEILDLLDERAVVGKAASTSAR